MRIFPALLIVIGLFGLGRYFGLIPHDAVHVLGPALLIAVGIALLFRRPRMGCRGWEGRREGAVVEASKGSTST